MSDDPGSADFVDPRDTIRAFLIGPDTQTICEVEIEVHKMDDGIHVNDIDSEELYSVLDCKHVEAFEYAPLYTCFTGDDDEDEEGKTYNWFRFGPNYDALRGKTLLVRFIANRHEYQDVPAGVREAMLRHMIWCRMKFMGYQTSTIQIGGGMSMSVVRKLEPADEEGVQQ